jgi:hypothetical protein
MSEPHNPDPFTAPSEPPAGAYGAPMPPIEPGAYDAESRSEGPPPSSVVNAARLMYLSAILVLVTLIVTVSARTAIRKAISDANPTWDAQKLDSAVNAAIAVGAVIDIVIIGLFVLLAFKLRRGRNWARIVTWIIAGLGVVFALSSLVQPGTSGSRLLTLISGLIDVAVIVLLLQRPSSEFFRHRA